MNFFICIFIVCLKLILDLIVELCVWLIPDVNYLYSMFLNGLSIIIILTSMFLFENDIRKILYTLSISMVLFSLNIRLIDQTLDCLILINITLIYGVIIINLVGLLTFWKLKQNLIFRWFLILMLTQNRIIGLCIVSWGWRRKHNLYWSGD